MVVTGKYSVKPYRCRCGAEKEFGTNHWGEHYSECNVCRIETGHPNGIWTCLEEPPEGVGLPEKWREVKLGDIVEIKEGGK
jgi:hypothetical protein